MNTVYVVDDDDTVRAALTFYLEAAGYRVRAFATGSEFAEQASGLVPGCVLLDVRMPGMDGFEVLAALSAYRDTLPVVVMTGHGDVGVAVRAMKLGALDFIEKPFIEATLIEILSCVFDGFGHRVQDHSRRVDATTRMRSLSERELEVLNGLKTGQSNKIVGYHLGISTRTVEMHRANMMDRLGVRSLAEALHIAFEGGGIVSLP